MTHLTPEQARVLLKRIRKVIERARYYPATVCDMDEAAYQVIAPYTVEFRGKL